MYDFAVAGAGFYGATFARIATDLGKKCIVFDKLPHVAGYAADAILYNQLISLYGAHIFHTESEKVWNFVNRFGEWQPFVNRPKAISSGRLFSFPINLMTFNQLYEVTTPREAAELLVRMRVPITNPQNFEEKALSLIGEDLYHRFIYGYTKKQYFREPRLLPASIFNRLPLRLTYDENYFHCKYQAIPVEGYSNIVLGMLDGIETVLDTPLPQKIGAKTVVHTGPLDEHFHRCLGPLEYQSMVFRHVVMHRGGDLQGNYVLNWCDDSIPHLRSIEHHHARSRNPKIHDSVSCEDTIVSYDIPSQTGPPLYPILSDENKRLYTKYKTMLPSNEIFAGRIGGYKYLDMDQAIASAMTKAEELCS